MRGYDPLVFMSVDGGRNNAFGDSWSIFAIVDFRCDHWA
jgi:hypothetical protein